MKPQLPSLDDVLRFRPVVESAVRRTPVIQDAALDALVTGEVLIKAEHLQVTASYKVRGLYARLDELARDGASAVYTVSSGNAGQALAFAAQRLGIRCLVVVPHTAIETKIAAMRRRGAEVLVAPADVPDLFAYAQSAAGSAAFVHPYDDATVVAGHGSLALELLEQAPELDAVLVPASGGGLLSAVALVVKALRPTCQVIGVQPEAQAGIVAALAASRPVSAGKDRTIADALCAPACGEVNLALIERHVDDVITLSDEQIGEAMRHLWTLARVPAEPGGAAAFAALLALPSLDGRRTGVVCTGGNVDVALLHHVVAGGTVEEWWGRRPADSGRAASLAR